MAYQFLRGNTAANDAYTGPLASVTIDTQAGTIRVHDGVTAGGFITIEDIASIQAIIDSLAIADIDGLQAALDAKAALSGGVDANFTLMPQVAGDSVISSGTNANGSWIRYSTGYQVVGQRLGVTGGGTWTFPQSFSTTTNLVVVPAVRSSNARFVSHDNITTTTVDILAWLPDGTTTSGVAVSTIATGFWQ